MSTQSPPTSPVVAGWELALRLRRRREEMGIEVRTIAHELGFSRNYWSAVENERKVLSEESLAKLLDLFEFDNEERRELLALRATTKERGWWTRYSVALDDQLQRLFGLESGAGYVRDYESILIPGLLQTGEYARELMTPAVSLRRVEVDQYVEIRLRRQARLSGDNPIRLMALISEAAIRQEIGGRGVLRRQLEHLVRVIEDHPATVEVRVIPFSATACGLFGAASIHMLSFENSRLPTVVWQETVTSYGVIEDPVKVRDIVGTYDQAVERSLSGPGSLAMIHRRIKELV